MNGTRVTAHSLANGERCTCWSCTGATSIARDAGLPAAERPYSINAEEHWYALHDGWVGEH